MGEVHVLTRDGLPMAAAWRFERLSEESASYSESEQKRLAITSIPLLEDDD